MASSDAAVGDDQPDFNDEDGGPITDIIEQLDDDDNVISYRLISADDSVNRVRAALEKAGVSESAETKPTTEEPKPIPEGESTKPVKKTVSFSDDIPSEEETKPDISFRARRVEQIMNTAKEQEKMSQDTPIIPEDEDSDDAALRQDMLRYGMGEIGAVVAELQLEEGESDDSGFDYVDEGFDEDFEEDDEDDPEDEYGRNGRVITNGYRTRMLELEKKLGIQSRSTQAERPAGDDQENSDDEGIGRITVNRQAATSSSSQEETRLKSNIAGTAKGEGEGEGKKNVRFASSLDIAPEKEAAAPATAKEKKYKVEPLSDIVERSPSSNTNPRLPSMKASRFKQARGETAPATTISKGPMDISAHFADQDRPTAPSGPQGTTIAETLVERQPTTKAVAPDEFDGSIAYQEVADEYQKIRRRFIQREGGFLKEDESPVQPVVDEDNQERISRFKAARLSRQ